MLFKVILWHTQLPQMLLQLRQCFGLGGPHLFSYVTFAVGVGDDNTPDRRAGCLVNELDNVRRGFKFSQRRSPKVSGGL